MTRYLALALFAEGTSDYDFLSRLLYRATYETAARIADTGFEVSESFVRARRWQKKHQTREERVEAAFGQALRDGAANVLFVHTDGGTDPDNAGAQRILPCFRLLEATRSGTPLAYARVAVIPVRETEAWALADPEALLDELGVRSLRNVSLPATPKDVEDLADPKLTLRSAVNAALGERRRRSADPGPSIPFGLAERIDLKRAFQVPAFRAMSDQLESELRRIWSIG